MELTTNVGESLYRHPLLFQDVVIKGLEFEVENGNEQVIPFRKDETTCEYNPVINMKYWHVLTPRQKINYPEFKFSFEYMKIPALDFSSIITGWFRYAEQPVSVLLTALVYMERIFKKNNFRLTSWNVNSWIIACLVMAYELEGNSAGCSYVDLARIFRLPKHIFFELRTDAKEYLIFPNCLAVSTLDRAIIMRKVLKQAIDGQHGHRIYNLLQCNSIRETEEIGALRS